MGWVSNSHRVEYFSDLGVVLFLFKMRIYLDLQTLMKMLLDVFGLGLSQFVLTTLSIIRITKPLGEESFCFLRHQLMGW